MKTEWYDRTIQALQLNEKENGLGLEFTEKFIGSDTKKCPCSGRNKLMVLKFSREAKQAGKNIWEGYEGEDPLRCRAIELHPDDLRIIYLAPYKNPEGVSRVMVRLKDEEGESYLKRPIATGGSGGKKTS
jgi:hypothetical protein